MQPTYGAKPSKPIKQGVAAAQQLIVTILDSSTASKGTLARTYSMRMQNLMQVLKG